MNNYSIVLIIAIICYSSAKNPDIKYPNCENYKGEEVIEGNDFIPPDNECIHCMCFKGHTKFCETTRCDDPPPLGCNKWTEICCNYTCHDNELNEMDEVNVHPYDSHETTAFGKLKQYARQMWNRMTHKKEVQANKTSHFTVGPTGKPETVDEPVISSEQSTPMSDSREFIPEDVPSPPQNETTIDVKDEQPILHNARNCRDVFNIEVEEGKFFIPGPSTCFVCRCVNGRSRFCTPVECDTHPPKDCINWTQDCCEYTCQDVKDPKSDFFLNRWIDQWFKKTTMSPPKDPYNENPL